MMVSLLLWESIDVEYVGSCDEELVDALRGVTGIADQMFIVGESEEITELVASQGKHTTFKYFDLECQKLTQGS